MGFGKGFLAGVIVGVAGIIGTALLAEKLIEGNIIENFPDESRSDAEAEKEKKDNDE
ncbi:MAG: hypothetical protein K5751_04235 [Treponemataceae bacterium]|nr:hypothetical protein [Treponemataceae bacterium]